MNRQDLFNYMKNEHGVTLLETDMIEIERIVMKSHHAQFETTSLDTLIKRVEQLKITDAGNDIKSINGATIDAVLEILRSVSVIKAKALRKKGTDMWYEFGMVNYREVQTPQLWPHHLTIGFFSVSNLPADAELVDIEILLP